jgi:hypothetical protein
VETVRVLVSVTGADLKAKNNFGAAPIHYTWRTGSYESMLLLLESEGIAADKDKTKGLDHHKGAVQLRRIRNAERGVGRLHPPPAHVERLISLCSQKV